MKSNLRNGLIAYWPLDTDKNDALGVYNLTTVGTITLAAPGWVRNKISAPFPGGNPATNYLYVPNNAAFFPAQLSVSAWVKLSAIAAPESPIYGAWYSFGGSAQRSHYLSFDPTTNGFYFDCSDVVSNTDHIASTGTSGWSSGVWYHVVGVYDGALVQIYVNGDNRPGVYSTATMTGSIANNSDAICIGTYAFANGSPPATVGPGFQGNIAHVGVWNRGLTQQDVLNLYGRYGGNPYPFPKQVV